MTASIKYLTLPESHLGSIDGNGLNGYDFFMVVHIVL